MNISLLQFDWKKNMMLTKKQIKQVEKLTGFKMLTKKQFKKLVYKSAKEYNKQFGYTKEFDEKESNEIVDSIIKNEWRTMSNSFIRKDWMQISINEDGYFTLDVHVVMVNTCSEPLEIEHTAMCNGEPISMPINLKWMKGFIKIFEGWDNE